MAVNLGRIVWQGDRGSGKRRHTSQNIFKQVNDAAGLDAIASSFSTYTDCNIYKKSFTEVTELDAAAPDADANIDYKGVVKFKDPDTLLIHEVVIPAFKPVYTEEKDEGTRILAADVIAIVDGINVATGKSYIALYGFIIQEE